MDAGSSRHYTSQERLSQLQTTEALFHEGLYSSALLITGIHLCTIERGEQWFQWRALERYARCLTRLKQHKRSLDYYRRSLHLKDAPLPADITTAGALSDIVRSARTTHDVEKPASPLSSSSSTQPRSTMEAMLLENKVDRTTMEKQKQARDQIKDRLLQSTSKLVAQKKNTAIATAAKNVSRFAPVTARLTSAAPPSIPPVVPQSETIQKHLATRAARTESVTNAVGGRKSGAVIITESAPDSAASLQRLQDEVDMDFAQSCIESDDLAEASHVLERIPEERRTVKMYLFLVQLARKNVDILSEKACWESIAEIQPLAIEAYIQLLRAQVPLAIVLNMIPSNSPEKPWMKTYLQGVDHFLRLSYKLALTDFSALNEKYPNNIDINLRMALCLKWMGKTARSCFVYSWVRRLDNHIQDDMYHYGVCLKRQSKLLYLNKLANDLLRCNEQHPDTWCVQALYWDAVGDKEKATRAVLKAFQLDPDHCGALQLRGQLSIGSNNTEALAFFRKAYRIDKDLITYQGLVDTYILTQNRIEALELAREVKRLMPDSVHALAIYGMTVYYLGDPGLKEALNILQKALRMDPGCFEAAKHLVTIYEANGQHQEAIQILDQQIDYQPVDKVHAKKAEIYTRMEQWELALSSYRSALSANPLNTKAKEGMAEVEKILSGGDDDEEDEAEPSDNHDEQDIEAMDADPDQHGHVRGHLDEGGVQIGEAEYADEFEQSFLSDTLLPLSRTGQGPPQTLYRSTAEGSFDHTPPPPPQQQRPPPTPQMPTRRIAPGSLAGSILNSPTLGHRHGPHRPPNVHVSQRERELDEFEDGGEEMDE